MKTQLVLPILILWVCCSSLSAADQIDAAQSKHRLGFSGVVEQTRLAIKHSDRAAFQKSCAAKLVLVESVGLHSASYEPDWYRKRFPISAHEKTAHTEYEAQAVHLLDLRKPLSKQDQKCLKIFFDMICSASKRSQALIESGPNLEGQGIEGTALFGPALQGKVNADTEWRIGFEKVSGSWKIRYVILAYAG